MPLSNSIPEPWLSFLRELDEAMLGEVRFDCMGGFVITMVYGFSRTTGDLDVIEIAPVEAGRTAFQLGVKGSPLHNKYRIYLDHVGVAHVRENYEDRPTEIFPGSCLFPRRRPEVSLYRLQHHRAFHVIDSTGTLLPHHEA